MITDHERQAIERLAAEGLTTRSVPVTPSSYDEKARSFEIGFASSNPITVFDWQRFDVIQEVLLMDGMELPANRQVPLLDSHMRYSTEYVKGSIRDFKASGDLITARAFVSSVEVDTETKIREGHITDISAGYKPLESYWIPEGQRQMIKGKMYDGPLKVTVRWRPGEGSITAIGADDTTKFRSMPEVQDIVNRMHQSPTHFKRGVDMETAEKLAADQAAAEAKRQKEFDEMRSTITMLSKQVEGQQEAERQNQIRALAERFTGRVPKIDELREEAIKNKISPDLFKGMIVDRISDDEPIDTPESELGLSKKDKNRYSFVRAIMHDIDPRVKADFEVECTRALREKGLGQRAKSILVPYDIQHRSLDGYQNHPDFLQFFQKRDLVTTSAASAGNLVGTNLLASSFIELLRNKMLLTQLGARMLTGLVGNIAIPRQTGAGTAVWETEGTGITSESTQTFDQLTMSPNEVGAYTEVSRKMLQQGTPAVEGLVQSDIATILRLAIDKAGFHGSGGTQPTGIVGTSGVGSSSAASLDWPGVVSFEEDVATANADVDGLAYVTTVAGYTILKTRVKEAGYPVYLLDPGPAINGFRTMNDYRVGRTNQITAGYMFFGDFTQVLVGEWGVLEMLVNPFILDKEGLVRITAHQSVDIGVRQAGAFSVASDLS